jgi:hypothetical protein
MSDDAAMRTDLAGSVAGADDVGERRRAILAERERRVPPVDDAPPPLSTSMVRPYARIAPPAAAASASVGRTPGEPADDGPADEGPMLESGSTPTAADAEVAGPEPWDELVAGEPIVGAERAAEPGERSPVDGERPRPAAADAPTGPRAEDVTASEDEPEVAAPKHTRPAPEIPLRVYPAPPVAAVDRSAHPWPDPVERLRAASAALWPAEPPEEPTDEAVDERVEEASEGASTPAVAATDEWAPPPVALPAPPVLPPAEPGPPGWSLFTPVVPPEPPADAPSASYPSASAPEREATAPYLSASAAQSEAAGYLSATVPEPIGAESWEHVSLRHADDDSWLRDLRDPATEDGDRRWPVGVEDDEPKVPPAEPADEHVADAPAVDAGPLDTAFGEGLDAPADVPLDPPFDTPLNASLDASLDAPPDTTLEGQSRAVPAFADAGTAPQTPHRGFGRAPAERLARALTDDVAPPPAASAEPDDVDDVPMRGTLEPVLRHSTERAKAGRVIGPPLPPQHPDDDVLELRPAPASWEEALAADVVPGGRRRRRRPARARHESGGEGEYRPRAPADRSLTLLVVAMLLVLLVLVGAVVWALWLNRPAAGAQPGASAPTPDIVRTV